MKTFKLTKKLKKNLIRIIVSLVLFLAVLIVDKTVNLAGIISGKFGFLLPFFAYFAIYLLIGYDVILRAAKNIIKGSVFDENFLMCVATFGAFGLGIYRGVSGKSVEGFDEACAVLLFYQAGEWFQSYATGRSRKSIADLMDIRPDYANLLNADGSTEKTDPSLVKIDHLILVNPGEKIPLDGIIEKGFSSLDLKALTGESLPKEVKEGDEVISGSINIDTQLIIKVTKGFYDSTINKILELVENASDQKSKAENFITGFARYYTPSVCIIALLLAIVPSLVTGEWSTWIYRALSFLVVSCPCALVISIPLSFFAGIGAASSYGILIKGSNYLEKFNKANIFVFDKTGTLTKGNFAVTNILPKQNAENILYYAAIAENSSNHPIAKSITAQNKKPLPNDYVLTNVAGKGVVAKKDDDEILCGNYKLMQAYNIECEDYEGEGTAVMVARNGEYQGLIVISDQLKEETQEVIAFLNQKGSTVMLTGDNAKVADYIAKKAGVTAYKASLLPQNKVEEIENMLAKKDKNDVLCFVGDGINDAPSLMRSDIGIAMGCLGSDAAIEASDIVLVKDDLKGLLTAKKIAAKTMSIVKQNIIFSIGVKVIILILSAIGIANMWLAVFGDVGVAVLAILNAIRVNSKYN